MTSSDRKLDREKGRKPVLADGDQATRDLRPFKFVVQAVLLEYEGDAPLVEHACEPVAIYGVDKLVAWAEDFEHSLEQLRNGR